MFAGRPWIDGRLSARSCNTVLSTFCPQSVQRLSSRIRKCGPHGRLPVNVAHPSRLSTICLATVRRLLSCCVFCCLCPQSVQGLSSNCPVLPVHTPQPHTCTVLRAVRLFVSRPHHDVFRLITPCGVHMRLRMHLWAELSRPCGGCRRAVHILTGGWRSRSGKLVLSTFCLQSVQRLSSRTRRCCLH